MSVQDLPSDPLRDAKRVLITGAAGRIGRALADHLGERYRLRLL